VTDYCCERDMKNGTTELNILVVIILQIDNDAAAHAPTTFGELIKSFDSSPRILQMLQRTSPPDSSHMRPGS
jgi:hypothetical protein